MLISTIDRVDNDGAAQQHEQPEDGEHGLGEAEAGTDLGLGWVLYLYFLVSAAADTRVARWWSDQDWDKIQDTIPDTGHGHWDNLGKLDSVISIPRPGHVLLAFIALQYF